MEKKSYLATQLLCMFFGGLGIHRFYTGYKGVGIAQILTIFGFFGIWPFIDYIMISLGKYKDANGEELEDYQPNIGYIFLALPVISLVLQIFIASISH